MKLFREKKKLLSRSYLRKTLLELKIFALKAQNRFPGLDGLSQFLEAVAVYVAHDKKTYGKVDIYSVLSLELSANDETIRKHY